MTHLRLATNADLPVIRQIAQNSFAPYVPRIGKPPAPMVQDYAPFIAKQQVTVAEDNGRVAGVVVCLIEADHLYVDAIAVDPMAQGRGIGRQLMQHAAQRARRLGLSQVRLCTNVKMTENIALYQRLGFIETGRGEQDGFERVFFRLSIGPE